MNEWWDLRDIGNAVGAFLSWLAERGLPGWLPFLVSGLIGVLGVTLWLLLSQLALVWIERRLIARLQVRLGPNRVGPFGLLQPLADVVKLLTKEAITVRAADRWIFWLAPVAVFLPAMLAFAVIPFGPGMVLADLNVGVLFVIAVGSLTAITIFMAGWSSNNKYSLLGAMRSVAMFVSYEVPQVLALLAVTLFAGSMSLRDIVAWQDGFNTWLIFLQPLPFVVFLIAGAVEVNRTPTDIAEAESEIVAGYHTEYSGIKFGFFYAAEYMATFGIAAVAVTLFLGGWTLWGLEEWVPGWLIFLGKVYLTFFLFIWSRGTLPRLRIDQLMAFAWKFLLPLSLLNVLLVGLEVLLWQESEAPAGLVLPIFAIGNWVLTALLVAVWAKFLVRPLGQRPPRVRLLREVGVIVYGQE